MANTTISTPVGPFSIIARGSAVLSVRLHRRPRRTHRVDPSDAPRRPRRRCRSRRHRLRDRCVFRRRSDRDRHASRSISVPAVSSSTTPGRPCDRCPVGCRSRTRLLRLKRVGRWRSGAQLRHVPATRSRFSCRVTASSAPTVASAAIDGVSTSSAGCSTTSEPPYRAADTSMGRPKTRVRNKKPVRDQSSRPDNVNLCRLNRQRPVTVRCTTCGECVSISGLTSLTWCGCSSRPPAATAASIVIPLVVQGVVDGPVRHNRPGGLLALGGLALLLGLVEALMIFIRRWTQSTSALGMEATQRNDLYAHLQRLPVAFHDQWQSGQLLSRVTTDLGVIRRFMSFGLIFLIVNIGTYITVIALLFHLYWPLGHGRRAVLDPAVLLQSELHEAILRRLPPHARPAGRPRHARRGSRPGPPHGQGIRSATADVRRSSRPVPASSTTPPSTRPGSSRAPGPGLTSSPTSRWPSCWSAVPTRWRAAA